MYGFGYTFQFSQMTKSAQVPSWVLFFLETKKPLLKRLFRF